MDTTYEYLVELNIDQRPPRTDWVSQRVYDCIERLGWFEDTRAQVIGKRRVAR